ncbi:MAG: ATP-NAD kinase family protein [Euryarchaeota archaeon]|nr:ATP-NAD kinase family protein [Euryarchaeota archaeon]
MKVGLIINPIAGMGGSVGLKGTDSIEILNEALRRGAESISGTRAFEALQSAGDLRAYQFFTAGGLMGESVLKELVERMVVVYEPSDKTSREDTKKAASALMDTEIDVLVFAGGDGTARDIMDIVGDEITVIGIPSGVKMHSGVFANTPRDAGLLLKRYRIEELSSHLAEVMDINESEFRKGRLSAHLYGYMLVPEDQGLIQSFKLTVRGSGERDYKEAIGRYIADNIDHNKLYILGPGTTIEAIGRELDVDKTLLGVDAFQNDKLVAKDVDEAALLELLDGVKDAEIIVTPIGAQGFIFGRGNQQISSRVIRRVGISNITVVATPVKMRETKRLKVDTGDQALDEELRGYSRVIIGYGRQLVTSIG